MRWTEEQYEQHLGTKIVAFTIDAARLVSTTVPTAPKKQANPSAPYRSKLERRYAEHLQQKLLAGEIMAWRYEPMKFRLAKATFYTPDFLVEVMFNNQLYFDEVKGTWNRQQAEKSRVKLKVAAELYPWFHWRGVTCLNGVWKYEVIG